MFFILGKIILSLFLALFLALALLIVVAWILEMKEPSEISNKKSIKRNPNYIVAFERIKNESNTHTCISCEKEFQYKLHNLYQQFGNCGGLDGELFVDCNCGCKNTVYTSY